MLITTANDFPGHDIARVLGEVVGLTVRSRKSRLSDRSEPEIAPS